VDRGEDEAVAVIVDQGCAEGHAPSHVAEGVISHDADVANRHLEFALGRAEFVGKPGDIVAEILDLLGLARHDLDEALAPVSRG
jgi:hypothetical protein